MSLYCILFSVLKMVCMFETFKRFYFLTSIQSDRGLGTGLNNVDNYM